MVPDRNRRYKQINFIGLQNNRHPSQHTVGNVHKASGNCQQIDCRTAASHVLGFPPRNGNHSYTILFSDKMSRMFDDTYRLATTETTRFHDTRDGLLQFIMQEIEKGIV
jgi:hypothetical protein